MEALSELIPHIAILTLAVAVKTKAYFFNGKPKDKKQHDSRLGNDV